MEKFEERLLFSKSFSISWLRAIVNLDSEACIRLKKKFFPFTNGDDFVIIVELRFL